MSERGTSTRMATGLMAEDAIAKRIMHDILASRKFQRYWIEELQQIMILEQQVDQKQDSLTAGFLNIKHMELQEIESELDQLVDKLQLAVETFLRSLRLAELSSNKFNNESATLYSVRVQLDRFVSADRFVQSKFLFIARRLGYLIKMFTIRVSNVFDPTAMIFYASTLCDMLYRFEEFTSIHCETKRGLYLQRATDDFYSNVIKQLNVILSKTNIPRSRSAQSVKATTIGRSSPLSHAQTNSSGLTVAFRQSYSDNRPKSFLLPADLEEKRYQLRQSLSFQRSMSSNKLNNTTPKRRPNRPANREEIENKWTKLMENDELLRKSIDGTNAERNALRDACEITRQVVEELEKRVHIV